MLRQVKYVIIIMQQKVLILILQMLDEMMQSTYMHH